MLHLFGSSLLIILIAFIIVDVIHNKRQSWTSLAGKLLLTFILFIALLRK